mmetsp:Transcript_1679/g.4401  ORF Transcript_1679/g.4401 Transcript_1679/m.4401 type:complete len:266 (-) Transcript_1679:7-804(-)
MSLMTRTFSEPAGQLRAHASARSYCAGTSQSTSVIAGWFCTGWSAAACRHGFASRQSVSSTSGGRCLHSSQAANLLAFFMQISSAPASRAAMLTAWRRTSDSCFRHRSWHQTRRHQQRTDGRPLPAHSPAWPSRPRGRQRKLTWPSGAPTRAPWHCFREPPPPHSNQMGIPVAGRRASPSSRHGSSSVSCVPTVPAVVVVRSEMVRWRGISAGGGGLGLPSRVCLPRGCPEAPWARARADARRGAPVSVCGAARAPLGRPGAKMA